MWQLTSVCTEQNVLPFSHQQGQSETVVNRLVNRLKEDSIELINAIERVHWKEKTLQFIICEGCGHVGCQPSNWVSLRRAGSVVLILPAFERMHEFSNGFGHTEYAPPSYLREKGASFLKKSSTHCIFILDT